MGQKILLSLSVFRLLRFCCSCLSNLTVSPHPVWLLAGVLAAAPAKLFLEPSSSSTPCYSSNLWFHLWGPPKHMAAVPVGKKDMERERQGGWGGWKEWKSKKWGTFLLGVNRTEKVKAFFLLSRSSSLPPSILLFLSPGHKHQTGKETDPKKKKRFI